MAHGLDSGIESNDPPSAEEEVLSLDLGDDSLLYRIRRADRVIYVKVSPDVVPDADRTESSAILKHLRSLPKWNQDWQTLTATGTKSTLRSEPDVFNCHHVPSNELLPQRSRINFLEIRNFDRISDRVFKGENDEGIYIVKIARFAHELVYLRNELRVYNGLQAAGFTDMPKVYGYVFEEQRDRVIGFAIEYLRGPPAGPDDLRDCLEVLRSIHRSGYVLGDLNRYNWIRTDRGIRVFDFEASTLHNEATVSPSKELATLHSCLSDTSGIGQR